MTSADLTGSPADRLQIFVRAFDRDGREIFVGGMSEASVRELLAERGAFEVVHLRGPGVPESVWRDAVTRQWRSK
jgi:hypothetical protein